MRALSAAELLNVWELGRSQSLPQRALLLLAAACPGTPANLLRELDIGRRDARLLALREWTFGPQLDSLVTCPKCGERLELTFGVADIRALFPHRDEDGERAETLSASISGYEVKFRLPNSLDLVAVTASKAIDTTRHLLLERCILTARCDDEEKPVHQLPTEVIDAVIERMAQADPQANLQLAVACPSCNHQWQVVFDIVSFFWSELNTWAQRTLREVHTLARAYGWPEADILAMSPWRRQCYLEMVSG
jgi:hypothetical protein